MSIILICENLRFWLNWQKSAVLILLTIFLFSPVITLANNDDCNAVTGAKNIKCAFRVTTGETTDPLDTVAGSSGAGYKIGTDFAKTGTQEIIATIITTVLSFLGVIFLILMIYGGFMWMTASGDEEQVKKALSIIRNALIGLIIVIAAYAISFLVMTVMSAYVT